MMQLEPATETMRMERVVFARDSADAVDGSRTARVFRQIETAMGARAVVDRRDAAGMGRTALPGLERVRLAQTLIAFDRAAHIDLADFEKRAVFTRDLALERPDLDIERLIWSSVNTSRAIALGAPAWTSIQALPMEGMSRHLMPPIDMGAVSDDARRASVRIVSHGPQPLAAIAMALLQRAHFTVVDAGGAWCDEAAIHLHLGAHDLDSEEPRIVDSWASGRLVVQMQATGEQPDRADQLRVEHERNGILCQSIGQLVVACEDVREDPAFWQQLVKAGHRTVAPLVNGWSDIAAAILA